MINEKLISNLERNYLGFLKKNPSPTNVLNYVSIQENHHTNFLSKILRSKKVFLKSFLALIFDDGFDDEFEIKTQCSYIDTLLKSSTKTIIIENKVCGASDRPQQIKSYIESQKHGDSIEHIYVVYLTTAGGAPSQDSLPDELKNSLESRYREINYLNDILPWLKNEVLPECHYKERSLIFSIELYIDYLNQLLGINENMSELARILSNILEKNNICGYVDTKNLLKNIEIEITNDDKRNILCQAINIVLREMERNNIYLREESVAYNLKWLLKNNPTPTFKNMWRSISCEPFLSIGQFIYGGHKYIQLATTLNDGFFRIHLCCTVNGIKRGPYLLADKKPIKDIWDIENLLSRGFTYENERLHYGYNNFSEKTVLTDIAFHIKKMIDMLNSARK